jgi:hypothetical protein
MVQTRFIPKWLHGKRLRKLSLRVPLRVPSRIASSSTCNTSNRGAISLYERCGFEILNPDAPIPDPQENNETYVIMARSVDVAPA